MKRFLAILFLVVLCAPRTFLFSSCGEGGSYSTGCMMIAYSFYL